MLRGPTRPQHSTHKVWAESFSTRLGIRPASQHAECSVCQRHKLIIKKLGDDSRARSAQIGEYAKHLKLQFADRTCYWASRSLSRLGTLLPAGFYSLTVVLDGIDHSKFKYPRSRAMTSKQFSVYQRPAMDTHGVICHGVGAFLALSEPFTAKDSSWCCDLLLHALHRASISGRDLRQFEICMQADNTSRECKNNTLLRLMALLCGTSKIKRAECRFLMSGHSHEDLDQWFSTIASLIEASAELHTPQEFISLLASHLAKGTTRPHEPDKAAFMVHSVRDWLLGADSST